MENSFVNGITSAFCGSPPSFARQLHLKGWRFEEELPPGVFVWFSETEVFRSRRLSKHIVGQKASHA